MDLAAPTSVVTAFVTARGRVLLLCRSDRVGTYRGKWAGVSGYLETEDPEEQARVEIAEELGLAGDRVRLERRGEPVEVIDEGAGRAWLVHPFRYALARGAEPRLDWEHVEMRWAEPGEIRLADSVPGLWEAWLSVAEGFGGPERDPGEGTP